MVSRLQLVPKALLLPSYAHASGRPTMPAMVARVASRLAVLVCAAVVLYLAAPHLYHFADYVRQTNPITSNQKWIEQAFEHTESELACLHGLPVPGDPPAPPADPIPNVVHFIFGLKNPFFDPAVGRFDFLSYLAVRSALVSLRPDAVYLHYTYLAEPPSPEPGADPLSNPWIRRLAANISLVHHPPAAGSGQYAHLSDTMRLRLLLEQGGIYLDMDAFALRPFGGLLSPPPPRDVVLGAEGGNRWGLCNAVVAARANSSFVARWLATYKHADLSREWNYHSVLLPRELAAAHPREVCALAPDAFFWPTWTWRHVDWMHETLSPEDARFWRAEIDRHGGSLFENQLVYHAWSQMAWDRYLKKLTPDVVRTVDTRFNLLVRRFLEDDL